MSGAAGLVLLNMVKWRRCQWRPKIIVRKTMSDECLASSPVPDRIDGLRQQLACSRQCVVTPGTNLPLLR